MNATKFFEETKKTAKKVAVLASRKNKKNISKNY